MMKDGVVEQPVYEPCSWYKATKCGAYSTATFFILQYLYFLPFNESKVAFEASFNHTLEFFVIAVVIVKAIDWLDLKLGF